MIADGARNGRDGTLGRGLLRSPPGRARGMRAAALAARFRARHRATAARSQQQPAPWATRRVPRGAPNGQKRKRRRARLAWHRSLL